MTKAAAPDSLGSGGVKLWDALISEGMSEHHIALVTEACRARDRLDKLDLILVGDVGTWCELRSNYDGDDTEVYVNDALNKANQTAGVLKNLLDKIPAPAAAPAAKMGGGTAVDQLRERRERAAKPTTTRARTAERRRPKQ